MYMYEHAITARENCGIYVHLLNSLHAVATEGTACHATYSATSRALTYPDVWSFRFDGLFRFRRLLRVNITPSQQQHTSDT